MYRALMIAVVFFVSSVGIGQEPATPEVNALTPAMMECDAIEKALANVDDPEQYSKWSYVGDKGTVGFNDLSDLEKDVFFILRIEDIYHDFSSTKEATDFLLNHFKITVEENTKTEAINRLHLLGLQIIHKRQALIELAIKKHDGSPIVEELKLYLKQH